MRAGPSSGASVLAGSLGAAAAWATQPSEPYGSAACRQPRGDWPRLVDGRAETVVARGPRARWTYRSAVPARPKAARAGWRGPACVGAASADPGVARVAGNHAPAAVIVMTGRPSLAISVGVGGGAKGDGAVLVDSEILRLGSTSGDYGGSTITEPRDPVACSRTHANKVEEVMAKPCASSHALGEVGGGIAKGEPAAARRAGHCIVAAGGHTCCERGAGEEETPPGRGVTRARCRLGA